MHIAVLCTSHYSVTGDAGDFAGQGTTRTAKKGASNSISCRYSRFKPTQKATTANQIELRVTQFARSVRNL